MTAPLDNTTVTTQHTDSACAAASAACVREALPLIPKNRANDRVLNASGTDAAFNVKELAPGDKLAPNQWYVFHLKDQGVKRDAFLYVPLNAKNPPQIMFAADGFTRADSNPAFKMGVVNGLQREAEKTGTYLAVLDPHTKVLFGKSVAWNDPDIVTAGGLASAFAPNDVAYGWHVKNELAKYIPGFDPSKPVNGCTGFSEGGEECYDLNKPRSDQQHGAQIPFSRSVEAINSTMLNKEQPLMSGVSLLTVLGKNDHVLPPAGGIEGFKLHAYSIIEGTMNPYRSAPYLLFPTAAKVNGLNLANTVKLSGPDYTERTLGPNAQGIKDTEYTILGRYGGHAFAGRLAGPPYESPDSQANGVPAPRTIFDSAKLSFCFSGAETGPQCDAPSDVENSK